MNQNKLAHVPAVETNEQDKEMQQSYRKGEIRLLDDLELTLAGGGDSIVNWP